MRTDSSRADFFFYPIRKYPPGVVFLMDPLIRTGPSSYVEVIMANASALFSSMVRAGKTTYFVDVKEAKNGKRYMAITENKIEEDDKKQRITVRVFSENVDQFRQAIDEAAAAVAS
jgi:hypothetical protein